MTDPGLRIREYGAPQLTEVVVLAARRSLVASLALVTLAALPLGAAAQDASGPWSLVVRGTLSGTSYESAPAGYKLYSGIAIEVGVRRELADLFALELALRTESREVTGPAGPNDALGGLEVVALTPTFQWRPRGGSGAAFQPYLGVGGAFSAVWEKSGALDSADLSPQLDPALQLGLDFEVSPRVALNLDARWHTLGWTIDDYLTPSPTVEVDPLVLGLGARVVF
ncbi:MAG: OmpW family outer membrane protein [Longimicrobiales bacterium]